MATNQLVSPIGRTGSAVLLALPGFLAFTLPPVGFLTSLVLPLFAARVRSRLWPGCSPGTSHVCAGLVVAGLWLPAVVFLLSSSQVGSGATIWLIVPLCAPSGVALWVPALLATAAYLTGLAVSSVVRHPWPWVLGAWIAPLAYEAASLWLVDFDASAEIQGRHELTKVASTNC